MNLLGPLLKRFFVSSWHVHVATPARLLAFCSSLHVITGVHGLCMFVRLISEFVREQI